MKITSKKKAEQWLDAQAARVAKLVGNRTVVQLVDDSELVDKLYPKMNDKATLLGLLQYSNVGNILIQCSSWASTWELLKAAVYKEICQRAHGSTTLT